MRYLLGIALLVFSTTVFAQHGHGHRGHHHGHWRHHGGGWHWVVPAIIGGVIVYEVTKPAPPPQQVVVIQPQENNCSPWTEIENGDGSITRTRTCKK